MSISDMGAAPEIYAAQNTKLTPFMRQIFFVRLWINYGLVLSVLILGGVSNSVLAQPTSCYIHVSFCRNGNLPVAQLGKTFFDNYEGASSNEWRCRARAADYANWCGNNQPWINLMHKNGKHVFDGWNPQNNGPQVQAYFARSPVSGAASIHSSWLCDSVIAFLCRTKIWSNGFL